jgi:hypothetical protein
MTDEPGGECFTVDEVTVSDDGESVLLTSDSSPAPADESLPALLQAVKLAREELDKAQGKVQAKFGQVIQDRLWRYITADNDTHHSPQEKNGFDWNVDGETVYVTWEETWSRGGHDAGSFSLPLVMLTDDGAALSGHESQQVAKQAETALKAQEILDAKELEQFTALKAKFEKKS